MSGSDLPRPLSPTVTRQRLDAALDAAQAGMEGRSRSEVRDLLVTELRARGLMMAPPEVELVLDGVFGGLLQRKAQRLAVQTKMAGFTPRFVGAALSHGSLPRWNVTASRAVHSTLPIQPVEVIVHQEASHHLGVGEAETFWVWFGAATPDSDHDQPLADNEDVSASAVAVFRGDYRVGVLDPHASEAWWPVLHESQSRGQIVTTIAARKPADNGGWRLLIGLPYRPARRSDDNNGVH